MRRYRPPRGAAWRLLAADALVVAVMLTLQAASRQVNHGPWHWRVAVIGTHLALAVLLPWAVWAVLVGRATSHRGLPTGALVMAMTVVGLTIPGVRTSWSGRPAEVTHQRITLRRLPKELDGLRVLVIGDLHLGGWLSPAEARARLAPVREVKADLVLFVGDLTGRTERGISEGAALLDESTPHVPRIAVQGNHDRWTHVRLTRTELREHGFTLLVNEHTRLRVRGTDLWVAGANDPKDAHDNLDRTFEGVPRDVFTLLLAHGPDVILRPRGEQADLIVVGHTHGGQINLPLVGPLACSTDLGPRVASGVVSVGRSRLFVTRGLGDGNVPLRVDDEPEIAVLELRRG